MRIILSLADGATYREIIENLSTTAPTTSLWKKRYQDEGVVGLWTLRSRTDVNGWSAGQVATTWFRKATNCTLVWRDAVWPITSPVCGFSAAKERVPWR